LEKSGWLHIDYRPEVQVAVARKYKELWIAASGALSVVVPTANTPRNA
jgi:hypothetical protein